MAQLSNVRSVERLCRHQKTFSASRAALGVAFGFGIWYSGPAFFVQHTGETIYNLLATVAGDGFSAAEIERVLRDADSLDIAELFSEIENAVRS